jgi:D-alanine-D-alanine ligase-like ATP-grasp enzyme
MYIITRRNIGNAQKAVQSVHAAIEATRAFVKNGQEHPSVIILEVKSEEKLKKVMEELDGKVNYVIFRESDRDNEITALATEPIYGETRKLFKRFQLIQ